MTEADLPAWTGIQRPQRADARRNFDALIRAAREVFAEHGTGASLEEIARRGGVGIGTLYRNFPTRDDLIEAVYVHEVELLAAFADEAAQLAPWESLEAWLRRFVEYIGTKRALLEGINRQSPVLNQCRVVMYDAGAPLLARAQAAGAARPEPTIEEAVRLISGVTAVAYEDAEQRDRVIGFAIDALRAAPPA